MRSLLCIFPPADKSPSEPTLRAVEQVARSLSMYPSVQSVMLLRERRRRHEDGRVRRFCCGSALLSCFSLCFLRYFVVLEIRHALPLFSFSISYMPFPLDQTCELRGNAKEDEAVEKEGPSECFSCRASVTAMNFHDVEM